MSTRVLALVIGIGAGFIMAAAGLSDPAVIRRMLLLEEAQVFLVMGSAIAVAALGVRLLRRFGARALVSRETVGWTTERPAARHVLGSVIFGAGWSVAATCPGPAAVMIGQGAPAGLAVGLGIVAGAMLQGALERRKRAAIAIEGAV